MKRLKELRKAKGMTQKELSAQLNVVHTTLSTWEQGKFRPNQRYLAMLSEIFDVNIDYLIGPSDNPQRKRPNNPSHERAAYALLLEDHPEISRDSEVGEIVYKSNFQMLMLTLLTYMQKNKNIKDDWIYALNHFFGEMENAELTREQVRDLLEVLKYTASAQVHGTPEWRKMAEYVFENAISKPRNANEEK